MADYLTIDELAAYLRTTERAVRRWRERGWGPPASRVGCRLLFERADVDRWVEARKELPRGEGMGARVVVRGCRPSRRRAVA